MKILATTFLALVFWVDLLIVSVKFGVANGINNVGLTISVRTLLHTGQ